MQESLYMNHKTILQKIDFKNIMLNKISTVCKNDSSIYVKFKYTHFNIQFKSRQIISN